MSKGKEVLTDPYQFYTKPVEIGRWKAAKLAIYDPSKSTVLGRTPSNWGELIVFYSLFYVVLAAMFSICMYGLLNSLQDDRPTYELSKSLIGINPGLGYRPYPQKFEDDGSVIWYKASDAENVANWTRSLDEFLSVYTNKSADGYKNRVACDFNKQLPAGKVCDVPVDHFGPCTSKDNYSYDKASPCVFLKLNRIYNWQPEVYSKDDIPDGADEDLTAAITKSNETLIWLTCTGVDAVDRENIGPVEYFPHQGFPTYYYPYTNTRGYVSPLVAVQFKRPQPGILINIECRAWAKNIKYARSRQHAEGSVHIEIMVDE